MNRQTLFDEVLHVLSNELSRPAQAWQLAIIVAALLAAWFYARHVERRAQATLTAAATAPHGVRVDVLKFSIDGFRRLAFPVTAMVMLVLGGLVLYFAGVVRSEEVHLLRLALLLLGAMAAIRLVCLRAASFAAARGLDCHIRGGYRAHYLDHRGAVRDWLAR